MQNFTVLYIRAFVVFLIRIMLKVDYLFSHHGSLEEIRTALIETTLMVTEMKLEKKGEVLISHH